MQLVAYGAQDIYLSGNPQITFWKVVYRRHTNFARESIEQTLNGTVALGNRLTATVSRNGDLLHRCYLRTDCDYTTGSVNPGHNMLDNVEVQIGGQQIDKHYGHWMEAWAELTESNAAGTRGIVDDNSGTKFQNMTRAGGVGMNTQTGVIANVPLQFWFCRNPGLALPLIALQYHEVKVIITLKSAVTGLTLNGLKLYCDYIYLDTDERRRFAQVSHEYLIEQVQFQSSSGTSQDLVLNHPVKELVFTGEVASATGIRTNLGTGNYQLKLNGHDRFSARTLEYFTKVQVREHHKGTPVNCSAAFTSGTTGNASEVQIGVYSFALEPEEHQPSGTCNFSRIDTAQFSVPDQTLFVYAVNYNVLRIMSGMGGLAYSN